MIPATETSDDRPTAYQERRFARVLCDVESLLKTGQIVRRGEERFVTLPILPAIPDHALLLDVVYNAERRKLDILLCHHSFVPVWPYAEIPILQPQEVVTVELRLHETNTESRVDLVAALVNRKDK